MHRAHPPAFRLGAALLGSWLLFYGAPAVFLLLLPEDATTAASCALGMAFAGALMVRESAR